MPDPFDLRPRILVHHWLGDFVLDPWAEGGGVDLARYGVRSYEVVWGVHEVPAEASLIERGRAAGGVAVLVIGGLVLWKLFKP